MKPPPFKYGAVGSVEEALALLGAHGDEASVLAGGQSLVPMLNMRLARPEVLVDINRVHELSGITANGDIAIGALTRQREVENSAIVKRDVPLLAEALRYVAHPAIRARGTLGGSAAHADPASEIPAVLVALNAAIVLTGPDGTRTIPAADFFVSVFTTAKEPTELLTQIRIPRASESARASFLEVSRRHGDFALVAVAANVELDASGNASGAHIVLTNVADVPFRAHDAEGFLVGRSIGDASVRQEAAELAASALSPSGDVHASPQYRIDVARTLVRRALERISEGEM